jgi:hypothetical protein
MRGHPIEYHTDACLMRHIDKPRETIGVTKARRRREQTRRLITPRCIEWVLCDRQHLNVGETERLHIRNQTRRQLIIRNKLTRVIALPRTQVHFINRHRLRTRIALATLRHVSVIVPNKMRGVRDFRGI